MLGKNVILTKNEDDFAVKGWRTKTRETRAI